MVRFGEIPYLWVFLAEANDEVVYYETTSSPIQRLSCVLDDVVFPVVRALAGQAESLPATFGFAVSSGVNSRSYFMPYSLYTSPPPIERQEFTLYVPAAAAAQLAREEITTQELMDASVLTLKDQGTARVTLSKCRG